MRNKPPTNKAVQAPPSLKGCSAIILEEDGVVFIKEEQADEIEIADEIEQAHLTRDERRALGRRGLL